MSEDVATQLRRDVEYCAWLRARAAEAALRSLGVAFRVEGEG